MEGTVNVLESGVTAGLVLVLYTLIDKILVPLIKGRLGNGARNRGGNGERVQQVINSTFERRIGELEESVSEIGKAIVETRTSLALAEQILERIEGTVNGEKK